MTREEYNASRRKVLQPGWRFLKKNGPYRKPMLERLFAYVDKNGPVIYPHLSPCWIWTGTKSTYGYGAFYFWGSGGKWTMRVAHRIMWQLYNGPIPEGFWVLHTCDNPPCCNPDHLFLGTQEDNMRDMAQKGRGAIGEKNGTYTHPESRLVRVRGENMPNHKLTWEKVANIRQKYKNGATRAALGREYKVSSTAIFHIVHNNKWKMKFSPIGLRS